MLYGCSERTVDYPGYTVIDIEEAFENNVQINLGKYVSSIDYFPLETNSESSLGRILRIKSDERNLYIHDFEDMNIKVFKRTTGEFVKLFDRRGRGPGEYLYCSTFDIAEFDDPSENQLVVSSLGSVYAYSVRDGGNIYQFEKPKRIVNNVAYGRKDSSIYLIFNKNIQKDGTVSEYDYRYQYLYKFDKKGNILSETYIGALMRTNAMTAQFMPYNEKLRVVNVTEDTIYNVNEDNSLSIEYIIDMGKYDYFQTVKTDNQRFFKLTQGGIYENDSFVFIGASLPEIELPHLYKRDPDFYIRRIYNSIIIYDKKEKKTCSMKENINYDYIGLVNDIDGGAPFYPSYIDNNKMYQFIEADDFMDLAERHNVPRMKEIAATLTEESNPVMVVATLK